MHSKFASITNATIATASRPASVAPRCRSIAGAMLAGCLLCLTLGTETRAEKRPPANVPPSQEIEVLDPGIDPEGRPAVREGVDENGQRVIDIPPVVLVHRFYYSGDRSFQGPRLPGGPSLLVFNHPRTGERCYVPAQMMPGAPRVTYTKNGIEYDYGDHALQLAFGWSGQPVLKYRSGATWSERAAKVLHVEQIKAGAARVGEQTQQKAERSKQVLGGAAASVGDAAKMAILPVKNTFELMPFGKAVFASDLGDRMVERGAEARREREAQEAATAARRAATTLKSSR